MLRCATHLLILTESIQRVFAVHIIGAFWFGPVSILWKLGILGQTTGLLAAG